MVIPLTKDFRDSHEAARLRFTKSNSLGFTFLTRPMAKRNRVSGTFGKIVTCPKGIPELEARP